MTGDFTISKVERYKESVLHKSFISCTTVPRGRKNRKQNDCKEENATNLKC